MSAVSVATQINSDKTQPEKKKKSQLFAFFKQLSSSFFPRSLGYGLPASVRSPGQRVRGKHRSFLRDVGFAVRHRCSAPGDVLETDPGTRPSSGACGRQPGCRLPPLRL